VKFVEAVYKAVWTYDTRLLLSGTSLSIFYTV